MSILLSKASVCLAEDDEHAIIVVDLRSFMGTYQERAGYQSSQLSHLNVQYGWSFNICTIETRIRCVLGHNVMINQYQDRIPQVSSFRYIPSLRDLPSHHRNLSFILAQYG